MSAEAASPMLAGQPIAGIAGSRFRLFPILRGELDCARPDIRARDGGGPFPVDSGSMVMRYEQPGQFRAGPDAEFAVDASEVGLHGLTGDEQGRRRLNVVEPSAHGAGDLEFLRTEAIQRGGTRGVPGPAPDAGGIQLDHRPGRPRPCP